MLQFRERFPPPPLENEDATPLKPSDVNDLPAPPIIRRIILEMVEYRQIQAITAKNIPNSGSSYRQSSRICACSANTWSKPSAFLIRMSPNSFG
jgi:hypothetical protein